MLRKIMNGALWPACPPLAMGFCDVDDVAAAHTLALFNEKASGRWELLSTDINYCSCSEEEALCPCIAAKPLPLVVSLL